MKKVAIFTALFFATIGCSVLRLQAQQTAQPTNSVWYEPASAKPGEAVTLNAFVYNTVQTPVTLTVVFRTDTKDVISTQTRTLGVGSGGTVSYAWKLPDQKTIVTVAVTKAINDKRFEVKSLEGDVGTITLDPAQPVTTVASTANGAAAWLHAVSDTVTAWRKKEASYCEQKKEQYQRSTGVTFQSQMGHDLFSTKPDAPQSVPTPLNAPVQAGAHDYYNLIWTSACSTLFGNATVFYAVAIVILFLVLRLLTRLF
jgi:hypothetical protein